MRRPRPLSKRRPRKPIPLPEALGEGRGSRQWHTREVGPFETPNTSIKLAEMALPLDDNPCITCSVPHNAATRLHEMIHATISPEHVPDEPILGAKPHNIIMAEEFRVNNSIPYVPGGTLLAHQFNCQPQALAVLKHAIKTRDFLPLIDYLMVTSMPPHEVPVIVALLSYRDELRVNPELTDSARKQYLDLLLALEVLLSTLHNTSLHILRTPRDYDGFPPWPRTIAVALYLQEVKKALPEAIRKLTEPPPSDLSPSTDKLLQETANEMEQAGEQIQRRSREIGTSLADKRPTGEPFKFQPFKDEDNKPILWAPILNIDEPRRTIKLPDWRVGLARRRAQEEGTIPRYMHRWPIDGAIFANVKRALGGSVLIDDSGSMSLKPHQIVEIMTAAPAGIIANYAGRQHTHGHLRILAKQGKRVKDNLLSLREGNNLCDLPALEWLAKQPYPRIWVSDGQVVSISHNFTLRAQKQCYDFCERNGITRVDNTEQARDILAGKRPAAR